MIKTLRWVSFVVWIALSTLAAPESAGAQRASRVAFGLGRTSRAQSAGGTVTSLFPRSVWKAGVAKIVITPRESIWLAGNPARTQPSEGVLQDIYAKALALQDETGAISVLVTVDLLGFTREMADTVADRAQKEFGVSRAQLVLNASHTHSGPVAGELLRPFYDLSEDQEAVITRYTSVLLDRIVTVIGASIKDLAPAQLDFRQGLAGFAVNRRRVQRRYLPGPVDQDVPVLSVRDMDGKLRAVVFGYACHNTALNRLLTDRRISGDYAGFAQAALEKEHPGITALFVEGCGADANPLPRSSVELAAMYGQILAAAVDSALAAKARPLTGPLKTAFEYVDIPFRKPPTREELQMSLGDKDAVRRRCAQHLLVVIARDGKLPNHYPYPVQVWQFGRDLTSIFLAGEVVVDYSLRFKSQYGWDNVWVAAYSNDVFAYIPSLRVLREGGYEAADAMIGYGQPGPFGAAVEEIIAEKVNELVERTRGEE